MFNKILILLLTLFLSSCYIKYNDKNICKEKNIDFINLNKASLESICNYKKKLRNIILKDNVLNIDNFYTLSKIDINSWKYILWFIDNNISNVKKIQLYYILKNIYKYSDEDIEKIIWLLDTKYKNIWISTDRIVLAENLLTQVFEWQEETINWIQNASWNLNYSDLEFLNIIFTLEPERFNNINLVADLNWWYNILKDEKTRKLYIDITNRLLNNLNNNQSKEIINDFLNKFK